MQQPMHKPSLLAQLGRGVWLSTTKLISNYRVVTITSSLGLGLWAFSGVSLQPCRVHLPSHQPT